jgi:hypothetical protein
MQMAIGLMNLIVIHKINKNPMSKNDVWLVIKIPQGLYLPHMAPNKTFKTKREAREYIKKNKLQNASIIQSFNHTQNV